ncbi:P-II family nitrogen regulator [Candidatus Nitrososphaera evergladensis]|nr:P-II family nitrogen regulator [Candidatus Nitrososphaera evergladensis]
MKKIELIVPNRWVGEIDNALKEVQIGGMSVTRIEGRGRVKPARVAISRGTGLATPEFIPRTKIEVVVRENLAEVIKKVLDKFGGDPNLGGKAFISDVSGAVDFVTQKRDEEAI